MWKKLDEIYGLDLAPFLSVPGLEWPVALKRTKLKLDLLTDINILIVVDKGSRGGRYHVIHRYSNANKKYMKNNAKNKNISYLNYWDVNNLYEWVTSQKLSGDGFKWV